MFALRRTAAVSFVWVSFDFYNYAVLGMLVVGFPHHWEYIADVQKYYRAVFELVTWDVAHNRCREFGPRSHLAEVNNARENEALKKFIDSFDSKLLFTEGFRFTEIF